MELYPFNNEKLPPQIFGCKFQHSWRSGIFGFQIEKLGTFKLVSQPVSEIIIIFFFYEKVKSYWSEYTSSPYNTEERPNHQSFIPILHQGSPSNTLRYNTSSMHTIPRSIPKRNLSQCQIKWSPIS
jgi:hypothetical protein